MESLERRIHSITLPQEELEGRQGRPPCGSRLTRTSSPRCMDRVRIEDAREICCANVDRDSSEWPMDTSPRSIISIHNGDFKISSSKSAGRNKTSEVFKRPHNLCHQTNKENEDEIKEKWLSARSPVVETFVTAKRHGAQSAGHMRKLLYLRENGDCRSQSSALSSDCSKNDPCRPSVVPTNTEKMTTNTHVDEKLSRAFFLQTRLMQKNMGTLSNHDRCTSSASRQKYLEGIIDSHVVNRWASVQRHGRPSTAAVTNKQRQRSAPGPKQQRPSSAPDHLITEFEWSRMSRLRRRLEELGHHELTAEEEDVFRGQVKQKQYRAKRKLLVVTRIFLAIQLWSAEKCLRTATELQWFTLNTSSEAKTLAFNKELFTKERAQAKVPEWAVSVMAKAPEDRSAKDCWRVHALMRGLKSFGKFTERIQLAMCRSMRYENLHTTMNNIKTCIAAEPQGIFFNSTRCRIALTKGKNLKYKDSGVYSRAVLNEAHGLMSGMSYIESMRIILRKGHIGLNFYFIYSGSVFINVEDVNAKGETFFKTEVVLSKGDSFGELALLQEVARTATVSARETCELLTVDKEVFSKLCPQIFDKELEEKIDFLQTVPLFQSRWWTKEAKRNLSFHAQIKEYKTNRIVVEDSTKDDWMYICMAGSCQIIRHLYFDVAIDESSEIDRKDEDFHSEIPNLLSPPALSNSDTCGRKSSFSERKRKRSVSKDKTRLLQSMGLALMDSDQKNDPWKTPKDEDGTKHVTAKFELTLSTLVNQIVQGEGQQNSVFLDIGTLHEGEVFDLEAILDQQNSQTDNKLILVSCGASLLRLKRKVYFQNASEECIQHANHVATKSRYPSDRTLLRSYQEKEAWDHYKGRVVKEVVRPHVESGRGMGMSGTLPGGVMGAGAAWPANTDLLLEKNHTELESRTRRLLKVYSSRTKHSVEGDGKEKLITMKQLGAFVLGTLRWNPATSCQSGGTQVTSDSGSLFEKSTDSLSSSQRIPTIVIN